MSRRLLFFNDTATTEIYTLSLHDALPISMRIAMVSEHASPLAVLGGVDAGGQNVHVASLATALGRRGDDVVVHTRRDDPTRPRRVGAGPAGEGDNLGAGHAGGVPQRHHPPE